MSNIALELILSSLGSVYLEAEFLTSRFSLLSSLGSIYLEAECLTLL